MEVDYFGFLFSMQNYYEILGIAKEAKPAEIKSAFKKLALKYHPDRNPNNPTSEDIFKKINEAYQTLNNETKRWAYDQKLSARFEQPPKTNYQDPNKYSTQGNATSYTKYTWTAPNAAAGDYSNQGKYYQQPIPRKKERATDSYVLAGTLFVIIATAALLFGFMMNRISAKDHYDKAVTLYENENYQSALMQLNIAINFQDDYTEAYILKGDINFKLVRFERALVEYNRAIKLSELPDNELITKRNLCKEILRKQ